MTIPNPFASAADLAALKAEQAELRAGVAACVSGLDTLAGIVNGLAQAFQANQAPAPVVPAPAVEAPVAPAPVIEAPAPALASVPGTARMTVPMRVLKESLRAHKAAGVIAYGVTVTDALKDGLMLPDGTLPGAAPVLTVVQPATTAPKATVEGLPWKDLQAAHNAHKAAGAIAKGKKVNESIAEGRMDRFGNLLPVAGAPAAAPAPVLANAAPEAPAQVSEPADGIRRRANGTRTPKDEWAARALLASHINPETGGPLFTPAQIDAAFPVRA